MVDRYHKPNGLPHSFNRVPHITVATDVICGFPTETEQVFVVIALSLTCLFFVTDMLLILFQDFEETVKIVELFKFPSLFINQFYPRPGTPAARMKRIDTAIVSNMAFFKLILSYKLCFIFYYVNF